MSIFLRLPHVFGPRWTEWIGSASATLAGVGLLHPYPAFDNSPTFNMISQVINEEQLGTIFLIVGVIRFVGLIINGRRKKITPWMRYSTAFVCFMLWLGYSILLALSGSASAWWGAWPVLAFMEFVNMSRSAQDARIGYGQQH